MATVHDVAAYILEQTGAISSMKLQKLVYYSQAWHLVWEERALFDDRIEAWANGPVSPALYTLHRGEFRVSTWHNGDSAHLTDDERESIDVVLDAYSDLSAHDLSELTHREPPWRDARLSAGLNDGDRGNVVITPVAMAEYYDSLVTGAAPPVGPTH